MWQIPINWLIDAFASIMELTWVKVFRINPKFRILRLTFHRKSASKCCIKAIIIASLIDFHIIASLISFQII